MESQTHSHRKHTRRSHTAVIVSVTVTVSVCLSRERGHVWVPRISGGVGHIVKQMENCFLM